MERHIELLNEFLNISTKSPGSIPSSWSNQIESQNHLVVAACTHGNEYGSLPAILKWIKSNSFDFRVTVFIGNPEAVKKNTRFVEEDLNRVYTDLSRNSLESQRAKEIAPLIQDANLFLDLHQTIEPTLSPFYIFRYDKTSAHWARAIGCVTEFVTKPILSNPETMTQNEFATSHGVPSLTIELGPKGLNRSSELLADKVLSRTVEVFRSVYLDKVPIADISKKSPALSMFKITHQESFDHPQKALKKGLKNLDPCNKGESLGKDENGKEFYAPRDGVILFPKYPERDSKGSAHLPLPHKIYVLAEVVTSDPELELKLKE